MRYNFISNQIELIIQNSVSSIISISISGMLIQTGDLSRSQQNFRVSFLGITFMIMFTAFNSLQNSVSTIYDDYGYKNLGTASLLFLYFVFGVSTFFTPFIIRKWGYKTVMFVSSLGYALYELAGLIIALWDNCPKPLGWILVMFGAATCGASASMIWVAQGSYVSTVAGDTRKTELFGLFWMIMMSSQIVGNILITFVLGAIGKVAYFLVLTALGTGSAFLFLWLPNVSANQQGELSVKGEASKIFRIIKNRKYIFLISYFAFTGVTIGFYATFLNKLVKLSRPPTPDQPDYTKYINTVVGYVFIVLGVSQSFTGLIMNRFFEPFCKYKLALIGTIIVELAGFLSLLCYFLQAYGLCFAVSSLWGISETYLMTNTGSLIGLIFPGQVESFSVFRICFALGVVFTVLMNIALEEQPGWIFLTVVIAVQLAATGIATQLTDLKDGGKSLISKEESERVKLNEETDSEKK